MAQTAKITAAWRLDVIAAETMGTEQNGCLEALLGANQGLAADGPYIAENTTITIPATPQAPPVATVNPWD
jgi:phage tail protein X